VYALVFALLSGLINVPSALAARVAPPPVDASTASAPTDTELDLVLSATSIQAGGTLTLTATLQAEPFPLPPPHGELGIVFSFRPYQGIGGFERVVILDDQDGVAELEISADELSPDVWTATATFNGVFAPGVPEYWGSEDAETFRYEPVPPLMDVVLSETSLPYLGEPVTFTIDFVDTAPTVGSVELFLLDGLLQNPQSLGRKPVATASWTRTFAPEDPRYLRAYYYAGTGTTPASVSAPYWRPEIEPPNTWINVKPDNWSSDAVARFEWDVLDHGGYYQPAVAFECSLDNGPWFGCTSPHETPPLSDGLHTFQIRGIDANGYVEQTPEQVQWRVDTEAPVVSFALDNGAATTRDKVVRVNITVDEQWSPSEYRIYNSLTYDDNNPELLDPNGGSQFRSSFDWDLTNPNRGGNSQNGIKTVYLQVSDHFGHWSSIVSASIVLDVWAPVAPQPGAEITTGTLTTTVPVEISWPEPTDATSGIRTRDYQRRINAGSWVWINPDGAGLTAVTGAQSFKPGSTYRYHQRATDNANNRGAWSPNLSRVAVVRQEIATSVKRIGAWSRVSVNGSSGGKVFRSTSPGARIWTAFTGSSIGWVSTKCSTCGKADVYIDGNFYETVDLFRSTSATKEIVWATGLPGMQKHTIEIRVRSSPGRPRVDLDAFVFLTSP
jgi:hypothetical protein